MHEAIHHILTHCGGLTKGEEVFIVYDVTRRDIADAFNAVTQDLGANVYEMELMGILGHGVEPMEVAANMMKSADLTISLCQYSLAHTKARLGAKRFLSLPQYSWEVLNNPAVMVDYEAQASNVRRFADAFTNGTEVRVTTRTDTDVTMSIEGRSGNYCPGFVRKPGDLGSPPDIEANVAPVEGSAKGKWFLKLDMLAECGVGLNPLAKICGNMLIDEGAFGSVHFGLGSNHTIGGKRDAGYHNDYVMPNASLWVDGVQMLKDGQLC